MAADCSPSRATHACGSGEVARVGDARSGVGIRRCPPDELEHVRRMLSPALTDDELLSGWNDIWIGVNKEIGPLLTLASDAFSALRLHQQQSDAPGGLVAALRRTARHLHLDLRVLRDRTPKARAVSVRACGIDDRSSAREHPVLRRRPRECRRRPRCRDAGGPRHIDGLGTDRTGSSRCDLAPQIHRRLTAPERRMLAGQA